MTYSGCTQGGFPDLHVKRGICAGFGADKVGLGLSLLHYLGMTNWILGEKQIESLQGRYSTHRKCASHQDFWLWFCFVSFLASVA